VDYLKVTFFYNQFQSGWTEQFAFATTDPRSWIEDETKIFMFSQMALLRAGGTVLYAVRAQQANVSAPKSYQKLLNIAAPIAASPLSAQVADVVSTSLQLQINGTTGKRRLLSLRGLKDGEVVRAPDSGGTRPGGNLISTLNVIWGELKRYGLQIASAARPPDAGAPMAIVAKITPNPQTGNYSDVTVTSDILAGKVLPAPVNFLGIPKDDVPGFPTNVKVLAKTTAAPWIYTVDYKVLRFTERKTGKVFGGLRGRARGVVKRQ